MVDIIIWRHAEAEIKSESGLDCERALTRKGHEDAHNMAKWLNKHLPLDAKIYCSPALRCLQTVEALTKLSKKKHQREVQFVDVLGIESNASDIRKQLIHAHVTTLLLVGHQPILGELVGDLLHPNQSESGLLALSHFAPTTFLAKNSLLPSMQYAIKKGAVWWLRQRNNPQDIAPIKLPPLAQLFILSVQHPRFLSEY